VENCGGKDLEHGVFLTRLEMAKR